MQEAVTRREREVWQACDTLWQQGEKLTGDALREQLATLGYAKGSFTEIYKYRKTWSRSRGQDARFLSAKPSTVLPDPITRAVTAMREELQAEAAATIQQMQQEAEQALQEVSTRLETTEQCLVHLQADYANKQQEGAALKEQLQTLQQRLEEERLQRSQEQGELQALRQQNAQLNATLAQQLTVFEQMTQQQRSQHQHERQEWQQALEEQKQQTVLVTEAFKAEKGVLEKQLQKAASSEQKLHEQLAGLNHQLQRLQEEVVYLKTDNRALTHNNQQREKAVITLRAEVQHLKHLEEELKYQLKEKEKVLNSYRVKIGRLEEKWQQTK